MDIIFKKIMDSESSYPREERNHSCIFKHLFVIESSILTDELFVLISSKLNDTVFINNVIKKFKNKMVLDKNRIQKNIECSENVDEHRKYYAPQIEAINASLRIESFKELSYELAHPAVMDLILQDYLICHGFVMSPNYIYENSEVYGVGKFLYEDYVRKRRLFDMFHESCSSQVRDLYSEIDVDLTVTDIQFSKYGLVSINDFFSIRPNKDGSSIVDERIKIRFGIDVPVDLLRCMQASIWKHLTTQLAFNITSVGLPDVGMEELEQGKLFSFELLSMPSISKLYRPEQYDDTLWINFDKDKLSLNFEELCADFPELGDHIVTQVIHLTFFRGENDTYFINHLDHEFILYELECYAERIANPHIKGKSKIKTFKVDNATIPLSFQFEGKFFLYFVLDQFFHNKDLIREYFSQVMAQT